MRSADALAGIPDVRDRASAAARALADLERQADAIRAVRDSAAMDLLDAGTGQAEVARIIGVTRGFIAPYYTRLRAQRLSAAGSV